METQRNPASKAPREIPMPLDITLFTRAGCPHCARAKAHLDARGWLYEEIALGKDVTMDSVRAVSGRATVPQVFIDGKHVGGADDLEAWLSAGASRRAEGAR